MTGAATVEPSLAVMPEETARFPAHVVGPWMMGLRLALAEGRISRTQYWQLVDAGPKEDARSE
jgi:hypothetical protein